MVRDTSLEAYNKIKADGLLSKRKWQVYDIVYHNGPLTAHRIVEIAKIESPSANQTSFNARLSELEELGVIKSEGKEVHPVSGKNCYLWFSTGEMPVDIDKKILKSTKIFACRWCHKWWELEDICECSPLWKNVVQGTIKEPK